MAVEVRISLLPGDNYSWLCLLFIVIVIMNLRLRPNADLRIPRGPY